MRGELISLGGSAKIHFQGAGGGGKIRKSFGGQKWGRELPLKNRGEEDTFGGKKDKGCGLKAYHYHRECLDGGGIFLGTIHRTISIHEQ